MVQMLSVYQREKGADAFTGQIMELAGSVSRYFPHYLRAPAEYYEPLTATEQKVLRLMALGAALVTLFQLPFILRKRKAAACAK